MDFLEHIPRQINEPNGGLRNTFVLVMNEIYRVLKPDGVLFASTPIYPHPSAFIDPTHVNIMSDKSYTYFIGSGAQRCMGLMEVFKKSEFTWIRQIILSIQTKISLRNGLEDFTENI